MRRFILFTSFIIINSVLDSCSPDSSFCYDIDNLTISNYSADSFSALSTNDTVAVNDYAIVINAETVNIICMANYAFGGSLLAEDPSYVLKSTLRNVSIKSNADLSANYPAGSELKDLFIPLTVDVDCINDSTRTTDSSFCITEYSNSSRSTLEEVFNAFMSSHFYFNADYYDDLFALNTSESIISNTHEITVRFEFENAESIELTTEPVILN